MHSTGIVLLYVKFSIMPEDLVDAKLHRVMNTLARQGALYSMDVRIYIANQIGTGQIRAGTNADFTNRSSTSDRSIPML